MGRLGAVVLLTCLALCYTAGDELCPVPLGSSTLSLGGSSMQGEQAAVHGTAKVLLVHHIENYFIVATDKGLIVKINKDTLAVEQSVTVQASFVSGVLWSEGDTLILGARGFPGQIYRLRLSSLDVTDSVVLDTSEPEVSDLLLVPSLPGRDPRLIAAIRSVPSHVIYFSLQDLKLKRKSHVSLYQEENFARGLLYNKATQRIVVVTDSVPPHLVELNLAGATTDSLSLVRASPLENVSLPLALNSPPSNGATPTGGLSELSTACHSTTFAERLFLGSSSRVIQVNTTMIAGERKNAKVLQSNDTPLLSHHIDHCGLSLSCS